MNDNPTPKMGGSPEATGYTATYVDGPAKGQTTEASVGIPPAYRYWVKARDGLESRYWWRWDGDGGGDMSSYDEDPDIEVAVYGIQSIARLKGEVKAKYGISKRPSKAEKQEVPPEGREIES